MRYAIYWAPAPGALADLAADWLSGRDIGATGLPREQADLVSEPARYGFHGTIKAPFRLAPNATQPMLEHAMDGLAARLSPLSLPAMRLDAEAGFTSIRPAAPSEALSRLAFAVVRDLDLLRAPLTEAEIARRRPHLLSPRQKANLDRWGYPHVDHDFHFHLTLTGAVSAADGRAVTKALAPIFEPHLPQPFPIDRLCLFRQADGRDFEQIGAWRLSGDWPTGDAVCGR